MKEEMPATTPRLAYDGPSSACSSGTPRMTAGGGRRSRRPTRWAVAKNASTAGAKRPLFPSPAGRNTLAERAAWFAGGAAASDAWV